MTLCDGELDRDTDVYGADQEQFSSAISDLDPAAFAIAFGRISGCTELY